MEWSSVCEEREWTACFANNQTERNGRASVVTRGVAAKSYGHIDRLGGRVGFG